MAHHTAISISILILILFFFSSPTFTTTAGAQGRAPHGLAYESSVAFSPSAVEFFHPNKQLPAAMNPCQESSGCSPFPMAAQRAATSDEEQSKMAARSSRSGGGSSGLGAGGVVGIVVGVGFAVFVAVGVFYVVRARRANMSKAGNSVQPQV